MQGCHLIVGPKLEKASHEVYKQKAILFQLMHILGVLILSYIILINGRFQGNLFKIVKITN